MYTTEFNFLIKSIIIIRNIDSTQLKINHGNGYRAVTVGPSFQFGPSDVKLMVEIVLY